MRKIIIRKIPAFLTGFCPGELDGSFMYEVEVDHEHEGIYASIRVGRTNFKSKSNQGGIKYASAKLLLVPTFKMLQLGDRVALRIIYWNILKSYATFLPLVKSFFERPIILAQKRRLFQAPKF